MFDCGRLDSFGCRLYRFFFFFCGFRISRKAPNHNDGQMRWNFFRLTRVFRYVMWHRCRLDHFQWNFQWCTATLYSRCFLFISFLFFFCVYFAVLASWRRKICKYSHACVMVISVIAFHLLHDYYTVTMALKCICICCRRKNRLFVVALVALFLLHYMRLVSMSSADTFHVHLSKSNQIFSVVWWKSLIIYGCCITNNKI